MSTAIMHQSALYDFGELLLKNQSHPVHSVQVVQQPLPTHASAQGAEAWAGVERAALSRAHSLPAPHALAGLLDRIGRKRLERTHSEPAAAPPAPLPPQQQPPAASRYKTELCRPFEEAGVCKYGDKCQFAHGCRELRNLQRHPKYKTELCRTYHSAGFCPYGPRCHFVHNFEEARRREPPSPGGSDSSGGSAPASPTFAFRSAASSRPSSPPDDARLPVFNRISSAIAAFGDLILA